MVFNLIVIIIIFQSASQLTGLTLCEDVLLILRMVHLNSYYLLLKVINRLYQFKQNIFLYYESSSLKLTVTKHHSLS